MRPVPAHHHILYTLSNNHNTKINRISPINNIINSPNYNSICINKDNNIHNLKNLKIDNESNQKSIKKYILKNDCLTIFPLSNENIYNKEKEQSKNSKTKKIMKNQNKKNSKKININNFNFRIKKIVSSNINLYSNY